MSLEYEMKRDIFLQVVVSSLQSMSIPGGPEKTEQWIQSIFQDLL